MFILGLILLLFIPAFALAPIRVFNETPELLTWLGPFLFGVALGWGLDELSYRRFQRFHTFEHELTHAFAAVMFRRKILEFVVTSNEGGYVSHSGGFGGAFGDSFIGLAPYVLPTFTFISVLILPLIPESWFPWFHVWIGTTFGFHTWSSFRETRENWHSGTFRLARNADVVQSDIGRRGFLFSGIFIASIGLAIHGLLFCVMLRGYSGIAAWASLTFAGLLETLSKILEFINSIISCCAG